jgi:hypothetical protein
MLNVTPINPQQQIILSDCIKKLNELYTVLAIYEDSPDKFWADFHIKSVMQWLTTIIGTGTVKAGIELPPVPAQPLEDGA